MKLLEFADKHPVWSFLALLVAAGVVNTTIYSVARKGCICPRT
jgi:hypothetical protein